MGKRYVALLGLLVLFATVVVAANKRFTLVIDAGHGGNDAGARGKFSKEKNINLNVALAFGRFVERNCPDVRVIYTRKTDVFVTLHERANIANRNKADLFVSIHTNALPKGKIARGMETYTLGMHRVADNLDVAKRENSVILYEDNYKQHYEGFDPRSSESYIMFEFLQDRNMAKSVELAKYVQKRACAEAGRPNKGVKQAGFLVLRETSMPSCLVELGFITTPDEENYLNSSDGVDALGRGIYKAFVDYKRKYDRSVTVPFQPDSDDEIRIPSVVPDEDKPARQTRRQRRKREKEEAGEAKAVRDDAASIAAELAKARGGEQQAPAEAAAKAGDEVARPGADGSRAMAADGNGAAKVAEAAEAQPAPARQPNAQQPDVPVFKVQIMASGNSLPAGSKQFKGLDGVECYEDGGMYKYTYGSSVDYNEIYRLRKSVLDKFPEAFIVAFKGGLRTDVAAAIREFKQNRNNKK
ncbi:N-acetylmuramoyl-L-alanine amidase [Marseilla massiliensis]|uniref:N-acetylmuramoyl-L-alanine amidase family protein n=1 Tax=Marseilla massiliensis TaxID=1841864 RepID=UPI0030C858EE